MSGTASGTSTGHEAGEGHNRRPTRANTIAVQVGDRQRAPSNLDNKLYPDGYTKAQLIQYYTLIAPVLLPHLAGR
ncbi:hypothetical protein [Kutzneria sp. 744]|uniref:hypothetical protein n=1 Tax=Kutzneria sp. (strain 744) TaxID=345341 RepID=UPI0004BA67E1